MKKSLARKAADRAHRLLESGPLNRAVLSNGVVVFLYHEVSDSPSEFNRLHGLTVKPASFARHLELIRSRFRIIDAGQLLSGDYRKPAALITFDDGNRSYFTEALPILREKRLPSTAFINMGPVLGEICWSGLVTYLQRHEPVFAKSDFRELSEMQVLPYVERNPGLKEKVRHYRGPLATEEDLKAAAADPRVTLGNHLYNHYNATRLSERLREEYRKNQRLLERYSTGSRLVSYPFGCWNRATTRMLLEEGAQALFVSGGLPNLNTRGPLFHRVELDDSVETEPQLQRAIFHNFVPALVRGQLSWS